MKKKYLSVLGLLLISLSIGAFGKTTSKILSEEPPASSSINSSEQASSDTPGGNPPRRTYLDKYLIKDEVEDTSDLQGYPWLNTSIYGVMNNHLLKMISLLMLTMTI